MRIAGVAGKEPPDDLGLVNDKSKSRRETSKSIATMPASDTPTAPIVAHVYGFGSNAIRMVGSSACLGTGWTSMIASWLMKR